MDSTPLTPNILSDLNHIIKEEGDPTNDPLDKGGPTAYGISQAANPEAWKNGPPTEDQARAIYLRKYVTFPKFDQVQNPSLQAQLIDFGVNSGPMIAIQKLQGILGVPVDGVLGPDTLTSLNSSPLSLNNLLVAARIRMIGQIVSKNPSQLKYLNGWLNRTLEFLV